MSNTPSTNEKRPTPFPYNVARFFANCSLIPLVIVALLLLWTRNFILALAAGYALNSLLTIVCYRTDKYLAQNQYWRVPEACLHCWELFWGWPGALFAQHVCRHKNAKLSFQLIFWCCVILNCAGTALLYRYATPENLQAIHTRLLSILKTILPNI